MFSTELFKTALSELKIGIDGISVFWTDGTMYVNGKDDTQASTQVGVDGSERCPYTYDKENDINIIDEDRLDEFVEYAVKYATKDLFKNIKAHIIDEIEADEGENVILRRK